MRKMAEVLDIFFFTNHIIILAICILPLIRAANYQKIKTLEGQWLLKRGAVDWRGRVPKYVVSEIS